MNNVGRKKTKKPMRKLIFAILAGFGGAAGILSTVLLLMYWASKTWQGRLESLLGRSDEEIWRTSAILIGLSLGPSLLAWFFSFDARAPKRPRLGMSLALGASGALAGTAGASALVISMDTSLISPIGLGIIAAGAAGFPLLWIACEVLAAKLIRGMLKRADSSQKRSLALFLSRLLLLFEPGRGQTMRSVALERFRRAERSEAILSDLQHFYDAGDHSIEIVEALCRIAAESARHEDYLKYLRELHELRPEDVELAEALIEEFISQNKTAEALKLAEKDKPEDDKRKLERYGMLLLDEDQPDRVVEIAQRLSELEGIPFKASGQLLRRALEKRPNLHQAQNLLGEQARTSGNIEQALRRWDASIRIQPNQPRVRRQLLEIYRETTMTEALEALLAEMLQEPSAREDESLALEYADVLVTNRKMEKAAELLAERVRKHPSRFCFQDRLAEYHCLMERWKQAQEFNEKARALAANDEEKSRCKSRLSRIERALLSTELYDLQKQVEAHPEDSPKALELIRKLIAHGQKERTLSQCEALMRRAPDMRDSIKKILAEAGLAPEGPFLYLSYVADLYIADLEIDRALELAEAMRARSLEGDGVELELCRKILLRAPNHLETLKRMGDIHLRQHHFTETVHCYVLFLAHGGKATEEINRALLDAYIEMSDYTNAKIYGEPLMAQNPKDDVTPLRLAHLAAKANDYDGALKLGKIARERNPKNYEAGKLVLQVERTRNELLSKDLRAKADRAEASPEEFEVLADLYRALGQMNDAIPFYQKAARDPSRSNRSKAKLALTMAEKGLFDLAFETISGVQLTPDAEETLEILDHLYALAKRFEEEHFSDKAGFVYKKIFLVDAGYKDVVKKVERYSG